MIAPSPRTRRLAGALMLSTVGAGVALTALPTPAQASPAAVESLVKQAQYWRSKGRNDLADQAMRRARALDPKATEPRAAASAKQAAPQRTIAAPAAPAAPKQAQSPAPKAEAKPAARAAAPAAPKPYTPSAADRAGQARVAAYDALQDGALETAANQFQKALGINRKDGDALGGLGLVRLRQNRFGEAADLLGQASRIGKADQWAKALSTARFFAGLEDARSLLAQGRVADAQNEAERVLQMGYGEPAPALELLAQIYEKQGRYADSAELYRQALQGGAQDEQRLQASAARGRALAAAQRGDHAGAESEFQNGLLLDRSDPWIRYEFARYMLRQGRASEAEGLLRTLATMGGADANYAAALLSNDLGRSADAERFLALIPENQRTQPMRNLAIGVKVDAAIVRAKALAASGQQAQAVTVLRQLGEMRAVPSAKLGSIADTLVDLGDQQGAITLAQNAVSAGALDLDGYAGVIGVLVRTGREDLAQSALQRAAQLAGDSPEGRIAYARMGASLQVAQADRARLAGQFATAFDMLQGAYAAAPDNAEVLAALARLYQSGNMPEKAAQTYQLVLGRDPRNKDALVGLAQSAQQAGDKALSERAQQDALKLYPQDYQVRIAMAGVERARGDEREAVRLLKDARTLYVARNAAAGNPFGGAGAAGAANPFRNMAPGQAQAAPPPVNPFALGDGTRLPQPQRYQGGGTPLMPANFEAGGPGMMSEANYPAQGYPAQAYPAQYPAPTYPAQTYPAQAYPAQGYPAQGSAAPTYPAPAYPQQPFPAPGGQAYPEQPAPGSWNGASGGGFSGDPVLAQIQNEIAQMSQESGPAAEVNVAFRSRSGEVGLSKLDEIKGTAKISTDVLDGRVYAKGEAVVIDAGRPTGSGLARFGRNATPEAAAIVAQQPSRLAQAETQHNSGIAPTIGYESNAVQLEAGTTPIGMGDTQVTWRAAVSPRLGANSRVRAWFERRSVTDSVISYAGTVDPESGARWGQVMRTGGGVGFTYDRDGNGFYAEGRYNRYRGENVRRNHGIEANVGGYLRAYADATSKVSAGINVNYQSYDNSQNYFTYGHGGYFSPQDFISVSFPINYSLDKDSLEVRASLVPGFQSYNQERTDLYPIDPAGQAELDRLKALNTDVRSYYDSISKTGFAVSADASVYYRVGPSTRVGGDMSYNTFGNYDEFKSLIGVRQSFGSGK